MQDAAYEKQMIQEWYVVTSVCAKEKYVPIQNSTTNKNFLIQQLQNELSLMMNEWF